MEMILLLNQLSLHKALHLNHVIHVTIMWLTCYYYVATSGNKVIE